MIDCAYCERPLICERCQTPYRPPTLDDYRALSIIDVPVTCPACGEGLTCHWCKTPYDGKLGDQDDDSPGDAG
jgi:hypothetical protein